MDLMKIDMLIHEGKFLQALTLLNSNTIEDEPQLIYKKCRLLIETGNLEESLTYIDEVISAGLIDFKTKLKMLNEKSFCHWRLGNIEDGLETIQEGLGFLEEFNMEDQEQHKLIQNLLLITKALIYSHIGKLEESVNLLTNLQIQNSRNIVYSRYVLGISYWKSGNTEKAISCCESAINTAIEIHDHYLKYNSLIVMGNIYLDNDEFVKAKQLYEESVSICEMIDDNLGKSIATINIAEIQRRQGNYIKSLQSLSSIVKILEEIGNKQNLALSIELMGLIYEDQGKLDLALDTYKESYQYRIQLANKQDIAWSHKYMASIYRRKDDYYNALEHYKKCIAIEEGLGNHLYISFTYLAVVILCCDMGIQNVSQYYLEKLEKLHEQKNNKIITAKYNLAFAYHLKQSNRLQNMAEAQRLFRKVAVDTSLSRELTIFAMTNLTELLLFEVKLYGGEDVLDEVKVHAQNILALAKDQESFALLAQAYGLLANLSLIELNLKDSKNYLDLGYKIAKDQGLIHIQNKLEKQRDSFDSEINKWTSIVSKNTPVMERIEHSNVMDYI
ncbi:MAG: tetratricopeptide repeat protein, partial [Asgard group archaeon]|nr:tetratricopeptide repeat protein [Asgard group archaeon]